MIAIADIKNLIEANYCFEFLIHMSSLLLIYIIISLRQKLIPVNIKQYSKYLYKTNKLAILIMSHIDPFVPNEPFRYPLKTSENRKVF